MQLCIYINEFQALCNIPLLFFIFSPNFSYIVPIADFRGIIMKDYIEERVLELAQYILENKTTVRRAAKKYNVSKSTVHTARVT